MYKTFAILLVIVAATSASVVWGGHGLVTGATLAGPSGSVRTSNGLLGGSGASLDGPSGSVATANANGHSVAAISGPGWGHGAGAWNGGWVGNGAWGLGGHGAWGGNVVVGGPGVWGGHGAWGGW